MPDTNQAFPVNPRMGLRFTAAELLIPIFLKAALGDVVLARHMAVHAIDDYQPETPADYLNLARIIAFSVASLALLGHAVAPDTTMPDKLRTSGRANALNRSADQSERTMMQRRRYWKANPRAEEQLTEAGQPMPESPDNDGIEASITSAVEEYLATYRSARAATSASEPTAANPQSVRIVPIQPMLAAAEIPSCVNRKSDAPQPGTSSYNQMPSHDQELPRNHRMQTSIGLDSAGQFLAANSLDRLPGLLADADLPL